MFRRARFRNNIGSVLGMYLGVIYVYMLRI